MTDNTAEIIEQKKYQRRQEFIVIMDSLSPETQDRVLDAIDDRQAAYEECYGMEPWEALDRATDYVFDSLIFFFVFPASSGEEGTGR